MISLSEPSKPSKENASLRLCVIIPCLNEAASISDVVRRVPRSIPGIAAVAVVVLDDGSTDQSVSLAKQSGADVISNAKTEGVGYTFQIGLEEALRRRANIIVNMDGDGQFSPEDIPRLIDPILQGKADLALASRFKDATLIPVMPPLKLWGNRQIARLISFLVGRTLYDVACGFRAYSEKAALQLNLFGKFTYTHETLLDLAFKNIRIVEVPLKVRGVREFGESRVARSVWKYAVRSLKIIVRTYKDYKPLVFFGGLSLAAFIPSVLLGLFFLGHFLLTGKFSGQLWAGFSSGFLFVVALAFGIVALVGDHLARMRQNQEKILYFVKRMKFYGE